MTFNVSLDSFNGPLDLMLHLVKEKKLDLFNLEIDVLIDQYIEFIANVQKFKLEVASEYLYELAALIEFKSRKCLPMDQSGLDINDYQKDTKEDLVKRLIEYQQFKDISAHLLDRYTERSKQIDKPIDPQVQVIVQQEGLHMYESDSYELIKAMQKCIMRFKLTHPSQLQIIRSDISLDDRVKQLLEKIQLFDGSINFENLIEDCDTMHLYIVTFLAILELIRQNIMDISTDQHGIVFTKGERYGYIA
jgi:segregation and condensation protein A